MSHSISNLSRNLHVLFENQSVDSNLMAKAAEITQELRAAEQRITDLKHRLGLIQEELNGALALTVRRLKPGLNVGVNRDGCKIGYKTKNLLLSPDVLSGIWKVRSNQPFARKFARIAGQALTLDNLSLLARAIVSYFEQHFRTLGEEIDGTGLVVVENKLASLILLAEWHRTRKPKRKLNSRLVRAGLV